jgi:hypothetical protein
MLSLILSVSLSATGVFAESDEGFLNHAKADLAALREAAQGLKALQGQLNERKALFAKTDAPFSPDEKRTLLTAWGAVFSYQVGLEGVRRRYWDFVRVLPNDRLRHGWGYVLTHTALTAQLAYGVAFADLAAGRQQLEVLLDEPNADYGIPARSFTRFKDNILDVSATTSLFTGDAYRGQIDGTIRRLGAAAFEDGKWALQAMLEQSRTARLLLKKRGVRLFLGNAADIFSDHTQRTLFPVQKGVAESMGDTRVWRRNRPLITPAQVQALLPKLQPGDVVVTRQNWFLSNLGLPGFWPHAELYLGTPADLATFFDTDAEVKAWLDAQPGHPESLERLLSTRFPRSWGAYANGKDFQGHGPIRIMEAISEGVSFTATEHAFGVDYLGVMRPRRSKLEKAQAIARAFGYHGRPYDFNFDFFSDATLVCTELVYKSYMPSMEMKGLAVELVNVAGRMTLPANEWVKLFDREADKPDRQLDFVAFLDGREHKGDAVEADQAAFRRSHTRLKWDLVQK